MKLAKTTFLNVMATATLVSGLALAVPVRAEHLRPTGEYSDARLGETGSVGTISPSHSSRATADATRNSQRSPQSVSADEGIAAKAKNWASEKWHALKSIAGLEQTPAQSALTLKSAAQVPPINSQSPSRPAAGISAESVYVPPSQVGANLKAPAAVKKDQPLSPVTIDMAKVKKSESGVPLFDVNSTAQMPRLAIEREERYSAGRWALDAKSQKVMDERVIHALRTPDLITTQNMQVMTAIKTGRAGQVLVTEDAVFSPKGKVSRATFDKIVRTLAPEAPLKLKKFMPLTDDEVRFLSALMLYQQGDQCSAAVGILHKLSKSKGFEAEANYYMAMCSRKLGLESDFFDRAGKILLTQDAYYSKKILKEVGAEVPYEYRDTFGLALFKLSTNDKILGALEPAAKANAAYILAEFGAASSRFKTSLTWAKQVPKGHPKYLQAKFFEALDEYQTGSKKEALKIQEELITELDLDKSNQEFQALVALNLARMHFQEKDFKESHTSFLRVYKDHPMWLESLTELGWAQLMSGDYEGAIGNMYSIQSPFFAGAYKPESYVIRTIGYLNLCQYGDAYRTLSLLEHDYKPWLDAMEDYSKRNAVSGTQGEGRASSSYYKTVKSMLSAMRAVANNKESGPKEVDGLPVQVVKEMARHRDFINLQKALNREIDERPGYALIESETQHQLKLAQGRVSTSRKRADSLRKNLLSIAQHPELQKNRVTWNAELSRELDTLNDGFFYVDVYNEAVAALPQYRKEVIESADVRIADVQTHIEKILRSRMLEMKTNLARDLDNNELLRYEVFSGSGENIRFQVAGGVEGKRVPATVIPKSKALHWDFDGEYWEDEIGHYRSSLKNNCPATHRDQATADGGI